jgi:hypothetical protein
MAVTDEGTGGGAAESVGGAGDEDTGHGIILPPVACWHRSAARGTWHPDPDYRSRAGEIDCAEPAWISDEVLPRVGHGRVRGGDGTRDVLVQVEAAGRPVRPSPASEATAGTAASATLRARNERRFVDDIVVPFKNESDAGDGMV